MATYFAGDINSLIKIFVFTFFLFARRAWGTIVTTMEAATERANAGFCKRLPSHTDQEQACSRITRLFVRSVGCHHAENGPIHRKMVVHCPLVITK